MFKDAISKIFKVDNLLHNVTGYVETRVELLKVEVKEDLAKGLAKGAAWFVIGFLASIFLLFVSVCLALLIGERWGNPAGFGIIAAIYLIAAFIAWGSRHKLIANFENKFTNLLQKKDKV